MQKLSLEEYLQKSSALIGVNLTNMQLQQCLSYSDILIDWNTRMNLTAITEKEDIIKKHILDALTIVQATTLYPQQKIIDIGTGAGLPGLILAIAFPTVRFTLTDALQKRITFLKHVVEKLGLQNVTLIHARAEELGQDASHREQYDIALARSVANMAVLAEYCLPLVRVGGNCIAYKATDTIDEMKRAEHAIEVLGGTNATVIPVTIPQTELKRSLVVVHKAHPTPSAYPRRTGKPKKDPL